MLGYTIPKPKIGVMLEVPSMIFLIPHLAGRVDFISVGTNDLTQYLLAVDRNNTRVASLYDSLHPAMLQVLRLIAEQGKQPGCSLASAVNWPAIPWARCCWWVWAIVI